MSLCSPQPLAQCQGQNVWLEPPMVPRLCPLEQEGVSGCPRSAECHREGFPASHAGPCPSEHSFGQTQLKNLPWRPARVKHVVCKVICKVQLTAKQVLKGKWQKSQEVERDLGMQLSSSTRVSLYSVHTTLKVNKKLGLKVLTDFVSLSLWT